MAASDPFEEECGGQAREKSGPTGAVYLTLRERMGSEVCSFVPASLQRPGAFSTHLDVGPHSSDPGLYAWLTATLSPCVARSAARASWGPTLNLAPPSPCQPSSSLLQTCTLWPLGRQNSKLNAMVPSAPVWNGGRGHTGAGHVAEVLAPVTPVNVANLKEAEACVGTTQVLVDSHGVELALKVSQAHP